jgi:hypothetical protein
MPDKREYAAVMKTSCSLCHAPAGSHCANHSVTIVWPPHLCRMDAYTHRLDPSEDWPMVIAEVPKDLQYVASKEPAKPLLWTDPVFTDLPVSMPNYQEE